MWYLVHEDKEAIRLESVGEKKPYHLIVKGYLIERFNEEELKELVMKSRRTVIRDGIYLK